jgi:uncharacterized protein YcbX
LRNDENVALSGLYVYPIKSCAGISMDSAELSATGLRHDRRWMLVDGDGKFMSQRAHPRMALRFPCRLVRKPDDDPRLVDSHYAENGDQVGFADGFAFLLISEASLEELNDRLEDPLPMNRFRPNFVVRGCNPYAEDGWGHVRIGDVSFRVAEACPRCAITTTDQETGARGKEPLRTLATYRKFDGEVFFGRNLIHDTLGTVRVGDSVEVTPRR